MNSFALFLSPLALLVPVFAGQQFDDSAHGVETVHAVPEHPQADTDRLSAAHPGLESLARARREPVQRQVRIEGRVVIRISPGSRAIRDQMLASLPRRQMATRFAEVDHEDCVPLDGIVGLQPMNDNRLLFLMNNRHLLVASLERGCSARAFYSDSYVERSEDGKLCIERDRLRSRAGANCELSSFNRLVAISE